jgi:nitrate/nitrite-specific signal transduction histidine kinase
MSLYLMQMILYLSAKEADHKGSAPGVVKWVLENTHAKIKEFIEQILRVVNMLFQAKDKNYHLYDDAVRMSFMLSVFIFIVVTIARIR